MLSKFDLISPTPYRLDGVGSVKAVTLREIDSLVNKNDTYSFYIQMLMISRHGMFVILGISAEDADELIRTSKENGSEVRVYDLITSSVELISQYIIIFDFFFAEEVGYDKNSRSFVIYNKSGDNGVVSPIGYINRDNFADVSNVILQRCGVNHQVERKEDQKFKNEKARRLWEKMNKPNAKTPKDVADELNFELGNIISSLPSHCSGLNMLNIWDMTIYNVYDQFRHARQNAVYKIASTSTAVWGNKDNHFDYDSWFKTHAVDG